MNTKQVDANIVEYIEANIIPQYLNFDLAHQINHAQLVIEQSLELARHYDVDRNMVYTIAAYHDVGLCAGRENHHIESGKILVADSEVRRWFDEVQILTIKEAIEDHRASSKSEPRSIYGKIVAEADRDIDPLRIIKRTLQYGLHKNPQHTKEEHYKRLYNHLIEKYYDGGYLKLWLPESSNAPKLSELRDIIADEDRLKRCFETIYHSEKV